MWGQTVQQITRSTGFKGFTLQRGSDWTRFSLVLPSLPLNCLNGSDIRTRVLANTPWLVVSYRFIHWSYFGAFLLFLKELNAFALKKNGNFKIFCVTRAPNLVVSFTKTVYFKILTSRICIVAIIRFWSKLHYWVI